MLPQTRFDGRLCLRPSRSPNRADRRCTNVRRGDFLSSPVYRLSRDWTAISYGLERRPIARGVPARGFLFPRGSACYAVERSLDMQRLKNLQRAAFEKNSAVQPCFCRFSLSHLNPDVRVFVQESVLHRERKRERTHLDPNSKSS